MQRSDRRQQQISHSFKRKRKKFYQAYNSLVFEFEVPDPSAPTDTPELSWSKNPVFVGYRDSVQATIDKLRNLSPGSPALRQEKAVLLETAEAELKFLATAVAQAWNEQMLNNLVEQGADDPTLLHLSAYFPAIFSASRFLIPSRNTVRRHSFCWTHHRLSPDSCHTEPHSGPLTGRE